MGKAIYLHCTEGGSDKVYNIFLDDRPNGMGYVHAENGRRGSTLTPQIKTPQPVPYHEAIKEYNKLKNEKINKKRYNILREVDTDSLISNRSMAIQETTIDAKTGKVEKKLTVIPVTPVLGPKPVILVPQLLNSITEAEVEKYINDDAWMAQEKKDGHRRPIIADGKILGLNKKGEEVPLIEGLAKSLPKDTRIAFDGEQIGEKHYAFDILMLNGKSLREMDAKRRYELLKEVKFGKDIVVIETAFTTEEKRALYESLKRDKKEGIIFKRKTSAYKSGRPSSYGDHLKFKLQNSASFIVDSITEGKRSVGLVVLDGVTRVSVGKCTIPPNQDVPCIGDIVEVQYLYAYKGGSIFQPVYLRRRNSVDAAECIISQLVYKNEEE